MTIFGIDQDRDHHFTSQKRTCFDDQSFVIRKGTQQLLYVHHDSTRTRILCTEEKEKSCLRSRNREEWIPKKIKK